MWVQKVNSTVNVMLFSSSLSLKWPLVVIVKIMLLSFDKLYVGIYVICCQKVWNTFVLTHWGRVTHICVDHIAIIGSDNGLWPGRRQAIIWTIIGILLIEPLGTKYQWIFHQNYNIFCQENAFENVFRKLVAILSRPQWDNCSCLVLQFSWVSRSMYRCCDLMLLQAS